MSNDQANPTSNEPSLGAPDAPDTEAHVHRYIDEQGNPDAPDTEGHRVERSSTSRASSPLLPRRHLIEHRRPDSCSDGAVTRPEGTYVAGTTLTSRRSSSAMAPRRRAVATAGSAIWLASSFLP